MKQRVIIVEDHEVFRLGLCHLLEKSGDFDVVGEADSLPTAEQCLDQTEPDLVVLDVMLQGRDGLDLLEIIRKRRPATRVLILSSSSEQEHANRALESGAYGYVDKVAGFDVILCAVRSVAAGRSFVSLQHSETSLRHDRPQPAPRGERGFAEDLSQREREVLARIARGMTNQQAADELFLSVKTVETYRSRLNRKLGARSRADLYSAAERAGLLPSQA